MLLLINHASKNHRRAILSLAGWLLLLQLPLPVVHAHADSSDRDRVLLRHVERHHADDDHQDDHSEELHFHWLMPWELLDDFSERSGNNPGSTADDNPAALTVSEVGRSGPAACGSSIVIAFRDSGVLSDKLEALGRSGDFGRADFLSWVQRLAMRGRDVQSLLNVVRC